MGDGAAAIDDSVGGSHVPLLLASEPTSLGAMVIVAAFHYCSCDTSTVLEDDCGMIDDVWILSFTASNRQHNKS